MESIPCGQHDAESGISSFSVSVQPCCTRIRPPFIVCCKDRRRPGSSQLFLLPAASSSGSGSSKTCHPGHPRSISLSYEILLHLLLSSRTYFRRCTTAPLSRQEHTQEGDREGGQGGHSTEGPDWASLPNHFPILCAKRVFGHFCSSIFRLSQRDIVASTCRRSR
jgi:hypothetical protein